MAKKKGRTDGWKRVEQGIYKRVWSDGSGGALLAKITLPGGGQKNSGSMPYFTNPRDDQATEKAVLIAVRRWRTDNLKPRTSMARTPVSARTSRTTCWATGSPSTSRMPH